MYYIPCNYVLLNGWTNRAGDLGFRRDNIELSRLIVFLLQISPVARTKRSERRRPCRRLWHLYRPGHPEGPRAGL